MKKIISLAVCFVLGSFVLAGCSNSSEPFEEKSYTPDTQINEINLDVQDKVTLFKDAAISGLLLCTCLFPAIHTTHYFQKSRMPLQGMLSLHTVNRYGAGVCERSRLFLPYMHPKGFKLVILEIVLYRPRLFVKGGNKKDRCL